MSGNKFAVEITVDHKMPYLSITHNGYQWTSIRIEKPRHEIPLIVKALQDFLNKKSAAGMQCSIN